MALPPEFIRSSSACEFALALLGAGLAWALALGLRRTTRGAHLESEGAAAEPRPALAG